MLMTSGLNERRMRECSLESLNVLVRFPTFFGEFQRSNEAVPV